MVDLFTFEAKSFRLPFLYQRDIAEIKLPKNFRLPYPSSAVHYPKSIRQILELIADPEANQCFVAGYGLSYAPRILNKSGKKSSDVVMIGELRSSRLYNKTESLKILSEDLEFELTSSRYNLMSGDSGGPLICRNPKDQMMYWVAIHHKGDTFKNIIRGLTESQSEEKTVTQDALVRADNYKLANSFFQMPFLKSSITSENWISLDQADPVEIKEYRENGALKSQVFTQIRRLLDWKNELPDLRGIWKPAQMDCLDCWMRFDEDTISVKSWPRWTHQKPGKFQYYLKYVERDNEFNILMLIEKEFQCLYKMDPGSPDVMSLTTNSEMTLNSICPSQLFRK